MGVVDCGDFVVCANVVHPTTPILKRLTRKQGRSAFPPGIFEYYFVIVPDFQSIGLGRLRVHNNNI